LCLIGKAGAATNRAIDLLVAKGREAPASPAGAAAVVLADLVAAEVASDLACLSSEALARVTTLAASASRRSSRVCRECC